MTDALDPDEAVQPNGTFVAALSGSNRVGVGELIILPLYGENPPETLRRPIELDGEPKWELWTLAGTQDWHDRHADYLPAGVSDTDDITAGPDISLP